MIREPLPRTRLGKYRRFLLPEIYERALKGVARPAPSEPGPEDRAVLARPLSRRILKVLEERYPRAAVTLDANLQLDLGIDSLEWLGLMLALEQRLGVPLADRDAAQVETVRDLIALAEAVPAEASEGAAAEARPDARWIAPTGVAGATFATAVYWINRLLIRALFRLRVQGLEHLPADGPYVLVANHASDLDPLVLGAALGLRHMRGIYWGGAASRLFARRWTRPIWRALHVMPVDERRPAATLALAATVLARGDSLVWFPETWRSPDGSLQRFQPGIGKLVAESGAPAVPVFIAGTFDALPRDRRLPRLRPLRVRIGAPLDAAGLARSGDRAQLHLEVTNALRDAVAALGEPAPGRHEGTAA